jgi:hypothetical protein
VTAFFFGCGGAQTPQVPPSLAQCLHPLQFLQALQYSEPLHPLDSQEAISFDGFVCANEEIELMQRNNVIRSVFIYFQVLVF